jgi:hypothetical protein
VPGQPPLYAVTGWMPYASRASRPLRPIQPRGGPLARETLIEKEDFQIVEKKDERQIDEEEILDEESEKLQEMYDKQLRQFEMQVENERR